MRLEVQEYKTAKRVTIIPSEENGVFVVDGDPWVGSLHANRAVGRIGIYGLDDETIQGLEAGELEIEELFQQDASTGSVAVGLEQRVLTAQVESDGTATGGLWKSIVSFREFQPVNTVK